VAAVFAPSVLVAAAATAAFWALAGRPAGEVALTAAAVLIVACPCALGLATPAAVAAALGRAAALGILVKRGDALERCAEVDELLLDKTGTLSEGRFAVEAVVAAPGFEENEVLALAAAAEGASTHPLAEAVRAAAAERDLVVAPRTPCRALPGLGVEAGEGESCLRVGSRALLASARVAVGPELLEEAAKLADRGLSLAFVAEGSRAVGLLAVCDPPRADARQAVSRLRDLGLDVALVTGDHLGAARLAAVRAGIADVQAGVSPEGKVEVVRAARARGARLLAAGDGINDAAALAAADVGVAMARGADVTLHAADVVVRAPRLGALADLVELSRATLRRIRQNLAIALGYNALAVPLAAAGWLDPLPAAVLMSLSSLVVTGNAVRLLRWRRSSA
jgi:Cu+-exporting ATPase